MSQRLAPLSRPVRKALATLAGIYVAQDLSRNAEGFEGFATDYMSNLSRKDRQLWDAFKRAVDEIREQAAAQMREELADAGADHAAP